MPKFLFNENVPASTVEAARQAGLDVASVTELCPGAVDLDVLARSISEDRILVTFDKDFGEIAFRGGPEMARGIILLRPRLSSPRHVTQFVLTVLGQSLSWEGHFSVATEGRIRTVPLNE